MKKNTPKIPAAYIALRMKPMPPLMTPGTRAFYSDRLVGLLTIFQPTLVTAFDTVNGRANSFTLSASDAIQGAIDAETRLATIGVTKANRGGTTVTVASGGPSANAYKYAAVGTQFTMRRTNAGDWHVTDIKRIEVHPKQSAKILMTVSPAARDDIVRHAMDGIAVRAEQPEALAA